MAERQRIAVQIIGEMAVVRFADKKIIDSSNIEDMGDEMLSIVTGDHIKHVLLNFDGVEFMSSAALNKLINMDREVKKVGGVLRLCNLRAEILEVFTLTRLNRVFDIRKTESEALKAFGVTV
ncbi:STAS domain-containing protein [Aureliella helgolandensis]|uniref:Anti-sigma factor antagonist n=1 Tax=Aureliella helgolandensis TaxID=2527968 RepID=A0A518G8T2_9BACT|nr:STAS domain-containing protein [Aureliella helgolandensis]QDV24996.1 Anti-sigma F factor antagonist [Aureliella helgolandensis]